MKHSTFDKYGRCFKLYHTDGGYSCERPVLGRYDRDECRAWANLQVEITYSDKSSPVAYHICERCAKDAFPTLTPELDNLTLQDEIDAGYHQTE